MKDKINESSSEIYHLNPKEIRNLGLEKKKRTRDNCYESHEEHKDKSKQEKQKIWDDLKEDIVQNGFLDDHPILIMINRKNANEDKIYQGHHRLAMAIELGLCKVPVRFVTKKRN